MTLGPYVPGKGNSHPKIVFVGEAPSYDEEISLTPFSGPSGRFLDVLLHDAKLSRSDTWVTNVYKHRIPPNPKFGRKLPAQVRAKSVGLDTDKCIDELRYEINQLSPNIIVPLGGTALWAVTGKDSIQKFRGSIISGMGHKVVGTFHPAHILHQEGDVKGYWNKQLMFFDLKRIKYQSEFKEIILPKRSLNVCKSSGQLYDFIERYKGCTDLSVDIEAHSCIPICIGLAYNRTEGLTVPLFNLEGTIELPQSELVNIWSMIAFLLAQKKIIGQNFGYDRDKIKRLGFIINTLKSDTMLKAFVINPELPKNLAFNTSIYTEEPYYKDEGMYEGSIDDLLIGCARDACVTKEVDECMDVDLAQLNLRPFYENFILPLHGLYSSIENEGLRVDEGVRKELLEKYYEWHEKIAYALYQIAREHVNTSSPKQVAKLLYEKWHLPERNGTGEEVLTGLLNSKQLKNELHRKAIELILEDRRVKKTIGTYLLSPTDFDGRMRTSYFICLETGRSSTNQQEPPIRPSIEYKEGSVKKKQARGMAFQTITKHGDIGSDIRKMFIPDEGEIFLQADSSQAEARVIFLLAQDYEALELIDKHDYHALTASWFVGGTEEDWSKKVLGYEHPNRFLGKTLRHAGHLGAGKRRASIETNTQARKAKIPINISEAQAGRALETFHKKQPKIKGIFHRDVINCINHNRRLIAPVPHGIDAPLGGIRTFYERLGDELYRQAFSYIPQRTVSENTKGAALRIKKRAPWIRILVEAHDSLLVSVPIGGKENAASILKKEFEKPINFERCSLPRGELIIPCEIEEGMNYKELSKFKWMVSA